MAISRPPPLPHLRSSTVCSMPTGAGLRVPLLAGHVCLHQSPAAHSRAGVRNDRRDTRQPNPSCSHVTTLWCRSSRPVVGGSLLVTMLPHCGAGPQDLWAVAGALSLENKSSSDDAHLICGKGIINSYQMG